MTAVLRSVLLALVAFISLAPLGGCGGPELCSGASCACPANETCAFGTIADTCRFECAAGASCTGVCTGSGNVACAGKTCTHTVGAGSTVNCAAGTCNFTCTGACSANCGSGCTLTCTGGTTQGAGGCS